MDTLAPSSFTPLCMGRGLSMSKECDWNSDGGDHRIWMGSTWEQYNRKRRGRAGPQFPDEAIYGELVDKSECSVVFSLRVLPISGFSTYYSDVCGLVFTNIKV